MAQSMTKSSSTEHSSTTLPCSCKNGSVFIRARVATEVILCSPSIASTTEKPVLADPCRSSLTQLTDSSVSRQRLVRGKQECAHLAALEAHDKVECLDGSRALQAAGVTAVDHILAVPAARNLVKAATSSKKSRSCAKISRSKAAPSRLTTDKRTSKRNKRCSSRRK